MPAHAFPIYSCWNVFDSNTSYHQRLPHGLSKRALFKYIRDVWSGFAGCTTPNPKFVFIFLGYRTFLQLRSTVRSGSCHLNILVIFIKQCCKGIFWSKHLSRPLYYKIVSSIMHLECSNQEDTKIYYLGDICRKFDSFSKVSSQIRTLTKSDVICEWMD